MQKWYKLFAHFLSFTSYFKAVLALFKTMGKTEEGGVVGGGGHCHHISEATGGPDHSCSSSSEPDPQLEVDQHDLRSYPRDRVEVNTCSLEVLRFGLDGDPACLQAQLELKHFSTPCLHQGQEKSVVTLVFTHGNLEQTSFPSYCLFQWQGNSTASREPREAGIPQVTGQSIPQPQQLCNISSNTPDTS